MKKIFLLLMMFTFLVKAEDLTMTFNGTSTTYAGINFTFSTGIFNSSSDGTTMQVFEGHPFATPINGDNDYMDINISESIYINSVNVSWATNVQSFKLQFLDGGSVVKELSSLTLGEVAVNITADKIRYKDSGTIGATGTSNSGGFELSNVKFDGIAPLPVELSIFTAMLNKNKTILEWKTATEINNYGFEIEKQKVEVNKNNSEWTKIGFVAGHGNSNSPKNYSFSDESMFFGRQLYRLKQIDIDGSSEYSEIVEIDNGIPNKFELMQNYPNPFNPTTNISFILSNKEYVKLSIYNAIGSKILTLVDEEKETGIHQLELDATMLPSGIYYYTLTTGGFVETKKMILLK